MSGSGSKFPCVLTIIGAVLSTYALYVEHKMSHPSSSDNGQEEEFVALCDIEAIGASCSHVFTLPEGRLLSYLSIIPHDHALDVPNAALGLTYYTTLFLLDRLFAPNESLTKLTVALNVSAMSSSVFLACKLLELGELCILCWTTHLINLLLLVYYVRILMGGGGGDGRVKSE